MVIVHLTNGFGNNIFQYVAARLLANFHQQKLIVLPPTDDYYAQPCLERLGVRFGGQFEGEVIHVDDRSYKTWLNTQYQDHNFLLRGYFEDYTYYLNDLSLIKGWFPPAAHKNTDDLVIHFRAGDRLLFKNEFDSKPRVENYLNAIKKFHFDKLHIVTDMPAWDYITVGGLQQMRFHRNVDKEVSVDPQLSVDYFNSFIDGFSQYSPLVEKREIDEDFNFIRSFDKILFQHGTLGWWAAALSDAQKVGVYGPWRPFKGASNKNLSQMPLDGWFQWE